MANFLLFIGLYPKLLLLVPHIILLQIIISGYQKREQEQVTSYRFGIFPVSENSPEYGRNMQNLQNMMGEMSDLYDLAAANAHYFDWSSEAQTMRIFQATIISFFVMSLTIWFIPIQPVLLVGGIAMFLINTKFAKYLLQELPQKLSDKKKTESPADRVLTWYGHTEKVLVNQDKMQEIAVYENQRYSYETGFGTKVSQLFNHHADCILINL
jgi:hypothetical protein